jgi:hypothetical protein
LKCDQLMTVFLLQVVHQWPDLLKGVNFDPSNQELIWHLLAKHGKSGKKPHPFIDEFIPTVEEDEGIWYTQTETSRYFYLLSERLWDFQD